MSETVSFSIESPYHDHFKVRVIDKSTGDVKELELMKGIPVMCQVKRDTSGNGNIEIYPQIGQSTIDRVVQDGEMISL